MSAVGAYGRHQTSQHAAAIAFRALFALVPLAALTVSLAQLLLPERRGDQLREWLGGLAPGDALEGSLARALDQTGTTASFAGAVALLGLLWTASGLAFALRAALRGVWDEPLGKPFLRAKLVDLLVVIVGVVLVLVAFVGSVVVQVVAQAGSELAQDVGLDGADASVLGVVGQTLTSLALGVVALVVVFRVLAPSARPLGELLPGAIVGAVAAQVVIVGFSTYLAFVDVDEVYGALGGIFALLLLAYFVGQVVVLGAAVTVAWPATDARDPGFRPPRWIPSLRRRRAVDHEGAGDGRGV